MCVCVCVCVCMHYEHYEYISSQMGHNPRAYLDNSVTMMKIITNLFKDLFSISLLQFLIQQQI